MKREYWAVIGDVKGSRRIEDRAAFQRALEAEVLLLNERLKPQVAAEWVITAGDEFQGLLSTPRGIAGALGRLTESLHPVQLRFGVGYGAVVTELKPQAMGMDGPAFHRARRSLADAKRLKRYVVVHAGLGRADEAVSAAWNLAFIVRGSWTDRQREIVRLYRRGLSQQEIAREAGVSESAVSQLLKRSRVKEVWEAERLLDVFLERLVEG